MTDGFNEQQLEMLYGHENAHLLMSYLSEILRINQVINLTNITDESQAYILHLQDSLAGLHELNDALPGRYGDMGTGGGFPGVPLAIVSKRQTVLIDSVQKKMNAIESILENLSLSNYISTYADRIESLSSREPNSFAVLTARALSKLSSLMELASPLLIEGGRLICYKGNNYIEELHSLDPIYERLGMSYVGCRSYELNDGSIVHNLLVFEKTHQPLINLPRKAGFAQKKPLR